MFRKLFTASVLATAMLPLMASTSFGQMTSSRNQMKNPNQFYRAPQRSTVPTNRTATPFQGMIGKKPRATGGGSPARYLGPDYRYKDATKSQSPKNPDRFRNNPVRLVTPGNSHTKG